MRRAATGAAPRTRAASSGGITARVVSLLPVRQRRSRCDSHVAPRRREIRKFGLGASPALGAACVGGAVLLSACSATAPTALPRAVVVPQASATHVAPESPRPAANPSEAHEVGPGVFAVTIPMETPDTGSPPPRLTVILVPEGIRLGEAATVVSIGALEAQLRERDDLGSLGVSIVSDEAMPHARVVEVIEACRRAGVTRFAINVRPEDPR